MESTNKKKKNNRKKRRLLIALLMILLTGVVLSTGTYAWFTTNKTVTVSDITVNVASSNGLQISADAITFKTILANAELNNAVTTYPTAANQIPSKTDSMVPVSTVGEVDTGTGFMNMYKGEIDSNEGGQNILVAEKSTEQNGTTGDFISFDIFLQVTDETQIYLTSNSKVAANGDSTSIENASRIGFVYEGSAATGTAATTIQGLKAAGTTYNLASGGVAQEAIKIWEPNYDVHTAAGVTNAGVYGEAVYGIGKTVATTGGSILEYYGVKAPISAENDQALNSTNATYFTKVTPFLSTLATGIPTTTYAPLLILNPGINKVRIYMWVEGQDVDCENNASGGSLVYSLQISVLDKA